MGASINYVDKEGGHPKSVILHRLWSKLANKGGQNPVNVIYGCSLVV